MTTKVAAHDDREHKTLDADKPSADVPDDVRKLLGTLADMLLDIDPTVDLYMSRERGKWCVEIAVSGYKTSTVLISNVSAVARLAKPLEAIIAFAKFMQSKKEST